ncbi:MAG: type secretion protein Rhs, partial [Pedosphaera sp.]|nr:type secretion protein Rhs [Pedosphaera sp.]
YSWDAENRLISMTNIAGVPAAAQMRLDFGYDYMSRRISKAVVVSGSTNSLHFTYDGWNLIAELNGTNHALIRSYMWGSDLSGSMQGAGGVGGLLAISSPSSAQFTCFDGNGNITALIDSTNSSIVGQYEYGPFGEVIRVTGQTIKANPFGFSTKYQDDETSFLYYGLRFYNSSMGSWLSRDPIEEQGGFNLSTFAANDLINSIDILGLAINKPACVAKLAALGIKAAKLAAEIAKYDPVADGKGGFPMKYGSGKTTPGGHFKEIMDLKRGVYNDLIDYYKYCVCDKCDGGEPPPKLFENLVNQHIPVPVYPSSYLLLVPGSNGFWLGVGTGATVVGVGAGIGVGVLTAPEITIPAIFKCYAH